MWLSTFLVFIIRTIAASTCNILGNITNITSSNFTSLLNFHYKKLILLKMELEWRLTWYWRSWNTLSVVLVFSSTVSFIWIALTCIPKQVLPQRSKIRLAKKNHGSTLIIIKALYFTRSTLRISHAHASRKKKAILTVDRYETDTFIR